MALKQAGTVRMVKLGTARDDYVVLLHTGVPACSILAFVLTSPSSCR